eukprot:gene4056-2906_t
MLLIFIIITICFYQFSIIIYLFIYLLLLLLRKKNYTDTQKKENKKLKKENNLEKAIKRLLLYIFVIYSMQSRLQCLMNRGSSTTSYETFKSPRAIIITKYNQRQKTNNNSSIID